MIRKLTNFTFLLNVNFYSKLVNIVRSNAYVQIDPDYLNSEMRWIYIHTVIILPKKNT